jgi:hypothetical protein
MNMYLNRSKGLIILSQEEYQKYINSWDKKVALSILQSKYGYKIVIQKKESPKEMAKKLLGL